jgi:BMFP domain-containing protein YqiC
MIATTSFMVFPRQMRWPKACGPETRQAGWMRQRILPAGPALVACATTLVGQSLQFLAEHPDGRPDFLSPNIYTDELEALSMMDKQVIDKMASRLVSLVPPGWADAQQDLRANFQDVLAQGLRRLDLVTREEFDVQSQVLARTRAKVDELERRVAELEAAVATRGI